MSDAPRPIPDPSPYPSRREPVMAATSLVSVVAAILWLLEEFRAPLTDGQYNAILYLVSIVGPVLAGLWARRRVTPV